MKMVALEIEFPDDFTPPEKFDGCESIYQKGTCEPCPFYYHDTYDPYEGCSLGGEDKCPIRKYF